MLSRRTGQKGWFRPEAWPITRPGHFPSIKHEEHRANCHGLLLSTALFLHHIDRGSKKVWSRKKTKPSGTSTFRDKHGLYKSRMMRTQSLMRVENFHHPEDKWGVGVTEMGLLYCNRQGTPTDILGGVLPTTISTADWSGRQTRPEARQEYAEKKLDTANLSKWTWGLGQSSQWPSRKWRPRCENQVQKGQKRKLEAECCHP